MTRYYHTNRQQCKPGDIIQPGNYGRIIHDIGPEHPHWIRECMLETVRRASFPGKPSRWDSTYVCPSLETMNLYHSLHCPDDFIYLVEYVNPDAPRHLADFNCVQPIPSLEADMFQVSCMYWEASKWFSVEGWPGIRCEELLSTSPLRIIQQL